jgi:acetoin utilization protein AcuB
MIVEQVMNSHPRTVQSRSSVRLALRILGAGEIRHLPVVDQERVVGIVSDRDLRTILPSSFEKLERPHDVEGRLSQPISKVMTAEVLAVHPETELVDAIGVMVENRVGALPVVERETTKLVGIVSYVDVLKVVRALLERSRSATQVSRGERVSSEQVEPR